MSDYEIKVKARNNRILSRIRERGYATVAAFCTAHNLTYSKVGQIVTMRLPATMTGKDGKKRWRVPVLDLAEALGVDPSELFTERQAGGGVRQFTTLMHEDALVALAEIKPDVPALETPEDVARREDRDRWLTNALSALTERERGVIEARFGINGAEKTGDEIGHEQGVTRERIRQIEIKALRKLREHAVRQPKGLYA